MLVVKGSALVRAVENGFLKKSARTFFQCLNHSKSVQKKPTTCFCLQTNTDCGQKIRTQSFQEHQQKLEFRLVETRGSLSTSLSRNSLTGSDSPLSTGLWQMKTSLHDRLSPFVHSFIPEISIAPLQDHYHSEVLPTTALILRQS